ncbi:hypothetical protein ACO0M4_17465 [Streptomyces sp. RGM 3693]|uniref:hypothetical protein n=1 Tax=Streptomyces sp. RGM 3693 TaxID=3413284 RepID=UPI003D26B2F1
MGSVLVLDDYADASAPGADGRYPAQPKSPGVMRACEEFFGAPSPVAVASAGGGWGLGVYRHLDRAGSFR